MALVKSIQFVVTPVACDFGMVTKTGEIQLRRGMRGVEGMTAPSVGAWTLGGYTLAAIYECDRERIPTPLKAGPGLRLDAVAFLESTRDGVHAEFDVLLPGNVPEELLAIAAATAGLELGELVPGHRLSVRSPRQAFTVFAAWDPDSELDPTLESTRWLATVEWEAE